MPRAAAFRALSPPDVKHHIGKKANREDRQHDVEPGSTPPPHDAAHERHDDAQKETGDDETPLVSDEVHDVPRPLRRGGSLCELRRGWHFGAHPLRRWLVFWVRLPCSACSRMLAFSSSRWPLVV